MIVANRETGKPVALFSKMPLDDWGSSLLAVGNPDGFESDLIRGSDRWLYVSAVPGESPILTGPAIPLSIWRVNVEKAVVVRSVARSSSCETPWTAVLLRSSDEVAGGPSNAHHRGLTQRIDDLLCLGDSIFEAECWALSDPHRASTCSPLSGDQTLEVAQVIRHMALMNGATSDGPTDTQASEIVEETLRIADDLLQPWRAVLNNLKREPAADFVLRVRAFGARCEPTNEEARRWFVEHAEGRINEHRNSFAVTLQPLVGLCHRLLDAGFTIQRDGLAVVRSAEGNLVLEPRRSDAEVRLS